MCFRLSYSTVSVSSGSSLGSLTSTGSQGSQSSVAASLSDIYIDPCQRLVYDRPEIDRDALFKRIERLLERHDDDLPPSSCVEYNHTASIAAVPQDSVTCSSDAVSGVGCLPTYEQHLERQKCCQHAPVPTAQADAVTLTDSLQALGIHSITRQLIASSSADTWQPLNETFAVANDVQSDHDLQSAFAAQTIGYSCLGQSDASSGVSGAGSDCAVVAEGNRNTSRHLSSSSATESDSGICDASVHQ